MKDLLKKFMTAEEVDAIEAKYKEKNPGSTGLPIYISKARLDEEIGKKKTLEEQLTTSKKELETLKASGDSTTKKAVEEALKELKASHETEINALKKDYEITELIHKAGGRNVVAIKALINESEDATKEIERLKKEESYLFNGKADDVPPGTGKHGEDDDDLDAATEEMKLAVGIDY